MCQISDQATQKGLQNIEKHYEIYPILLFENIHEQQIIDINWWNVWFIKQPLLVVKKPSLYFNVIAILENC